MNPTARTERTKCGHRPAAMRRFDHPDGNATTDLTHQRPHIARPRRFGENSKTRLQDGDRDPTTERTQRGECVNQARRDASYASSGARRTDPCVPRSYTEDSVGGSSTSGCPTNATRGEAWVAPPSSPERRHDLSAKAQSWSTDARVPSQRAQMRNSGPKAPQSSHAVRGSSTAISACNIACRVCGESALSGEALGANEGPVVLPAGGGDRRTASVKCGVGRFTDVCRPVQIS